MKLLNKVIDRLLEDNVSDKALSQPARCPYCTFVALSLKEEVEHMETAHPNIIAERLKAAGLQ